MESLHRVTAKEFQRTLGLLCFLFDSVHVVEWEKGIPSREEKGRLYSHPLLLETPQGDRRVFLELADHPPAMAENEVTAAVWEKVYLDDLTHTYNRRYMNEFRFLRGGGPVKLGLILMDLRKFKQINDALGHSAGDQILIRVAETLLAHRREGDTVVRLGGDEFVLLFPEITEEVLLERVEELRAALARVAQADFGAAWTASFHPESQQLICLLNEADRKMYAEKRKETTQ